MQKVSLKGFVQRFRAKLSLQGFAGGYAFLREGFLREGLLRERLGELDELFYAELLGTEVEER